MVCGVGRLFRVKKAVVIEGHNIGDRVGVAIGVRMVYGLSGACDWCARIAWRMRSGMENPDGRLASVAQYIKQLRVLQMYTHGGSGNPTFSSPGDRRPTPANPNAKETAWLVYDAVVGNRLGRLDHGLIEF
ncbi:hypothetical protein Tco_1200263 [Tanacetum coccineum]